MTPLFHSKVSRTAALVAVLLVSACGEGTDSTDTEDVVSPEVEAIESTLCALPGDSTPPTVTLVTPAHGATSTLMVKVVVTATDNTSISRVTAQVGGRRQDLYGSGSSWWTYVRIDSPISTYGDLFWVTATDPAGCVGWSKIMRFRRYSLTGVYWTNA